MILNKNRYQRGFTLVELSIVIIIVSLLMASGLAVGTSMVQQAHYIDTQKKLAQIRQSLHDFYIVNGHLPCAARLNILPSHPDFGSAVDCSAVISGTERVGSPMVRIGMVPSRTLGLTDRAASDAYGNRIIYAVTEILTVKEDFGGGSGGIVVADGSSLTTPNTISSEAAYILVSTGADRKGATSYASAGEQDCDAGFLDTQNCDLADEIFRDAAYNSGDINNRFFDDIVAWAPKFHFMALDTESNALWSSNGEDIFATGTDGEFDTGYVGIGTDNPAVGLHIADNAGLLRLEGTDHAFMEFYPDGPATRKAYIGFGTTDNDNLIIRNEIADADITLLPSGSLGRVGVGTNDPLAPLDVTGNIAAGCCIGLYNPNAAAGERLWRMVVNTANSNFYLGYRTDDNKANIASGADAFSPFLIEYGAPNYLLTLAEEGRVGINTNAPTGMLTIDAKVPDSSTMVEALRMARNGTYGQYMIFSLGHAGHHFTSHSEVDNAKPVVFHNTTNSAHSAPSAGNLHYYFRIRGNDIFRIYSNNNAWLAGTLAEASDARLKKDITPVENALDKLGQINGVYYRWNGADGRDITDDRYMGLLAQEVQAQFPEAVMEDENGYLGVDKSALIAPLIEAVKMLRKENAAQAARIAELTQSVEQKAQEPDNAHVLSWIDWLFLGGLFAVALYARRSKVAK